MISTIHPGPLSNLTMSSQTDIADDDNLSSTGHAEVHQEDIAASQSNSSVVGQLEDLAKGGDDMETKATNVAQLVSDML